MAQKEVTVVINGKEHVSPAAESAGASLTLFGKKIPLVVDAAKLLEMGLNALRSAFQFAKQYVVDSIAAYDAYAASQTKLSAQSKLTGVSLGELNRIAADAKTQFSLSTVTANDAATTVAKYASRAGEAAQANRLLAAALDLGAASGLDAAATMEALEQGLRGQDEGFDKLLGKNPSALWKEYADANGLAVGKMDDTQKRLAELTALIAAGEKVQGSYNDRVTSGAGEQDKLNNALDDAKVRFGQAIQPARILVTQGLVVLVDWMGRFMLAIGRVGNALTVTFVGAFKLAQSVVGGLAVALGKVTGNKDLENWGTKQAATLGTYIEQVKKLEDRYLTTGKAAEESAAQQVTASRTVQTETEKAAAKAEAEARRVERVLNTSLGAPLKTVIGMTEGAIRALADAAKDQLPPDTAAQFAAHMRTLADRAKEVGDRITAVPEPVKKGGEHARDMAREVGGIVRGAIDASTAFGVIDDTAARTLTSAGNIAEALGRMQQSGFTFDGVVGVIGGVASIVSTMMQGDKERRQLTEMNNRRLLELNRGLSNLKLNVTGEDYQSFFGALKTLFGNLDTGAGLMPSLLQFDKTLGNLGLTPADLNKVAESYGIVIRRSNGDLDLEQLRKLFDAMARVGMGGGQRSFEERVQLYREGQELSGGSSLQKALDLVAYLSQSGVGALGGIETTDQTMLFNALMGVRARLNSGQIGADELGGLTANQLNNLLYELLSTIRPESAAADSVPRATTTTDDVVESNTGVKMSVASVQEVIEAMDRNVVDVLAEHTKLQDRIAVATEGSLVRLASIDGKMDTLIEATLTQAPRLNAQLAATRLIAAANAGRGPEFT